MPEHAPTPAPRFSWPMRVFLFVVLFDMVFRCFAILYPWDDWADALKMTPLPRRLPTAAERAALIRNATSDDPHPALDRTLLTCDSVWDFFKPWPEPAVRQKLRTPEDAGKYVICWLNTRLNLFENVTGFQQGWGMFSPGASTTRQLTRARLHYADGSEVIRRNLGDVEDQTHYFRWGEYRVRSYQMEVKPSKEDECLGYCNLLAHRYARNADGSPLKQIRLFRVQCDFAPPGVDPREFLQAQMRATRDSLPSPDGPVYPDFYEYNPDSGVGAVLK